MYPDYTTKMKARRSSSLSIFSEFVMIQILISFKDINFCLIQKL